MADSSRYAEREGIGIEWTESHCPIGMFSGGNVIARKVPNDSTPAECQCGIWIGRNCPIEPWDGGRKVEVQMPQGKGRLGQYNRVVRLKLDGEVSKAHAFARLGGFIFH